MTVSTETVAAAMGAGRYAQAIEATCIRFYISSELEKSHFLAQIAHESDGFATMTEYASGKAYEWRQDLGNIKAGDGVRFKGRGAIQCTGRANYTEYSEYKYGDYRLLDKPELVAQMPDCIDVAGWYWAIYRPACRRGALLDDIEAVTRAVNGGKRGLADRKDRLKQAKELFAKLRKAGEP